MLDVHPPHSKIHGIREFLIHILTITVGLLIATQIESFVEWRHHTHLAEEARASLRDEIRENLQDLKDTDSALKDWRKQVNANMDAMENIRQHPHDPAAQKASLTIGSHGMTLRNTAWRTAESTGALAYMPYAEAQRYAHIYEAQSRLLSMQQQPGEDAARAFGLVAKFGLKENSHITAEQAGELEQEFGRLAFHLADITAILHENIEANQAFVEGREPKGSFSESVK